MLVAILGDLPGLFCSGLAGFTRFDEFDCSHCAESANIADKIKSARPIFYATIKVLPDRLRARQKISVSSATVNNGFPMVAAHLTTAGDFRVVWQDDRVLSHTGWNTWYKRTANGGSTWSADVRLSNLTSGAPYKTVNGYNFPYGDYGEISVDSTGRNHVVWGEGISYSGPGGTWYTRGQ